MKLKSNTREQILIEARKIILKEGMPALSLRNLAKALGIKAPSIYEHYQSKKEILNALRAQCYEALYYRLKKALNDSLSNEKQLLSLGEAYINFSAKEKELFQLFFFNFESERKFIRDPQSLNSPYKILFDTFLKARPDLNLNKLEELTLGYWSLIHGFAVLKNTFLRSFQVKWSEPKKRILLIYIRGAMSFEQKSKRC